MAELSYTTRSIRQRGAEGMWEVTLSHRNPLTGEVVRTYHKVEAKTRKQAERKRDELILELERKGGALATGVTVCEFMDRFLDYKEESGTIEPSTLRGYRSEANSLRALARTLAPSRYERARGHVRLTLEASAARSWSRSQSPR